MRNACLHSQSQGRALLLCATPQLAAQVFGPRQQLQASQKKVQCFCADTLQM